MNERYFFLDFMDNCDIFLIAEKADDGWDISTIGWRDSVDKIEHKWWSPPRFIESYTEEEFNHMKEVTHIKQVKEIDSEYNIFLQMLDE